MSRRLKKPRRFNYQPRFYDPSRDEDIKNRIRIKSRTQRRNPTSALWIGVILIIVLYIYIEVLP